MSKGGAGKVYFVLYLAVILELLIIFIERDEAEEHLRRQQREAIQIVQTILSQLQTGTGTTGITASPKDNITLSDDPEATVREYDVIVAVGDSTAKTRTATGEVISGADIPTLEYIVSHLGNPMIEEGELGIDTSDIVGGDVIFKAELGTEVGGYENPRQTFGASIPTGDPNAYFQLNKEATAREKEKGLNVKVFRVNFRPNRGEGWYRLRFHSNTNKIVGVTGTEPRDEDTVRIGNVQLTVKQLRTVRDVIEKTGGTEDPAQSTVLTYINKLLDKDQWRTLPGNRGWTAIDVRVVQPDLPPPADPVAEILVPYDTIYWYSGASFSVPVKLGPKEGQKNVQGATLVAENPDANRYSAVIENPAPGMIPLIATASNGGRTEESVKTVVVERPQLVSEFRRQRASRATKGLLYQPETEWASRNIPPEHYHTVVKFDGNTVFSRAGTAFERGALGDELVVGEGVNNVELTVYWKPRGSGNPEDWVPILSTNNALNPTIVADRIEPGYRPPQHEGGFEYTWALGPNSMSKTFDNIVFRQQIGPGRSIGINNLDATCDECSEYGLSQPRVSGSGEDWSVTLEVADVNILKRRIREINGKSFAINLTASGRGTQPGVGSAVVTVRIGG